MKFYGDISGHFRNLLSDPTATCVVAVVGGPAHDCMRCPRRAVRRVGGLKEARWYDLKETEKRRFFDCFDSCCPPLVFGYATFRQKHLESLNRYHLLHQDVVFPPAWDLALRAFAYTEILLEMTTEGTNIRFHFDRFNSTTQSDSIAETIQQTLHRVDATHHTSVQEPGIQAADCLAGGIAEQVRGGEPWLDRISNRDAVLDCRSWALVQLEKELSDM